MRKKMIIRVVALTFIIGGLCFSNHTEALNLNLSDHVEVAQLQPGIGDFCRKKRANCERGCQNAFGSINSDHYRWCINQCMDAYFRCWLD